MANSMALGSLTLVDLTDLGEFSVYPMSNLPLNTVYNPDNDAYNPNWKDTNLTITPVCYYAGSSVTPTSVTYTVQKNTSTAVAISSTNGEAKSGNNLVVSKNRFAETDTSLLTYYVTATYTEPESKQTLTAMGQITFSLIKNASSVKTCVITGSGVFKYDTTGKISGVSSLTLTGTVSNATITKWQYKTSSGVWADYPNGTITGANLVVNATDDIFVNDVATIKLLTSEEGVYDICQVVNLRDGAAGVDTVSAVLSNEDQMIPCNSNGTPTSYNGAITTLTIYEGGKDVTSQWTIETSVSSITGNWDVSTYTYTVTGISADTGSVTFTCSKTGHANIIKTFNLIKMKTGANGTSPTIYDIVPTTLALNRSISNTYAPATVTFSAFSQTGSGARNAYSGRFKIYVNGSSTATYTSSSNESSYTYTPSGNTLSTIKCELYVAGGGGIPVDTQTVVVTEDGKTGNTGRGISSTTIKYASSTDGVNYPTTDGDWKDAIPAVAEGSYLWTKTTYTYTSGDPTTSYSVSKMGASGTSVTIKTTEIKYVASNSGTTKPDNSASWQTDVPSTSAGQYLWTRTIVTYSDNTSTTSYAVGRNGDNGVSACNVVALNYSDTIPCTSGGKTTAQYVITIPFDGYQGTTKKYTNASVSGDIYGANSSTKITPVITAATSTASGSIVYTIPASSLLASSASTKNGEITVTYTVTNGTTSAGNTLATVTQKYSWVKTNAATNGTNAVFLDIYAPNGDIIEKNAGKTPNNVTLTARLMNGASEQTSNVTYAWYQYKSTSTATDKYDVISGQAAQSLTVTPSMINGFGSFKCVATYSSKTYTAYASVRDLQDELQVQVFSSIGDKILNGQGTGYVYAIVRQAGNEIDALPEVVTDLSKATGTACYLLDTTNKTAIYKTRSSTSTGTWTNGTRTTTCTYKWTFRDKDGKTCNFNGVNQITSQVFYVDGSLIDKKIIFDIDVTKN